MLLTFSLGLCVVIAIIAGGFLLVRRSAQEVAQGRLNGLMAVGGGFTLALVLLEMMPIALSNAPDDKHWVLASAFGGLVAVWAFDRWVAPRLAFLGGPGSALAHAHGAPVAHHAHAHGHDHGHGHSHDHDHHDHSGCHHSGLSKGAACSAIGCLVTCLLFDGAALGTSVLAGQHLGALVLAGVLLHAVPEGLLVAMMALATGGSTRRAQRVAILAGSAFGVGMVLPFLMGSLSGNLLPFTAGTLLYTVITHLLPAAAATRRGTVLAAGGGVGFWVLDTVIDHLHTIV